MRTLKILIKGHIGMSISLGRKNWSGADVIGMVAVADAGSRCVT